MKRKPFLSTTTQARREYYVDLTTGNDTTGNGSFATPWATIQKAANTVPIAGGCDIMIAAGTYTEGTYLLLNRTFLRPVRVIGYGGTVTIQGNGTGLGSVCISTNAAKVEFNNLTIVNNGSTNAVFALNNSTGIQGITFTNCTVTNTSGGRCFNFTNVQMTACALVSCTITGTGASSVGIRLSGKATGSLYLDTFIVSECTISAVDNAILLEIGWMQNLLFSGGTYTATGSGTGVAIGNLNMTATGPITNLTIANVTIRGNNRGIELGAGSSAHLTNLTIQNCDIDVRANLQVGVYLWDYVDNVLIDDGSYYGGGVGVGGIGSVGTHNTNLEIRNATIGTPDEGSSALAAGIGGFDGIYVHDCLFTGSGRGLTLQDYIYNAVIEDCTMLTDDIAFRVGHAVTGAPYHTENVVIRRCTGRTWSTNGLVIGEGVQNIEVDSCDFTGASRTVLILSTTGDNTLYIHDTILSQSALASGNDPMIRLEGTQDLRMENMTINCVLTDDISCFELIANVAIKPKDVRVTNSQIVLATGKGVYGIAAGVLDTGVVYDGNNYVLNGGTFGTLLGSACADLAAARAAWDGYGDGTNDDTSTAA